MSDTKTLTYSDVSEHNSKKDLYLVVHEKVYNATDFVDEHPGGEEVLLDVGGQDATEAFEDVGHSDEARELLDGMLIGGLERVPGDPEPKSSAPPPAPASSAGAGKSDGSGAGGMGVGLYAVILVGGALAFGAYMYLKAGEERK